MANKEMEHRAVVQESAEETTLTEQREYAWNALRDALQNIDDDDYRPLYKIKKIVSTIEAFVAAHCEILIDCQHHGEDVEPFEFMREKMKGMKDCICEAIQGELFVLIRTMLVIHLARRAAEHDENISSVAIVDPVERFFGNRRQYLDILRPEKPDYTKVEDAVTKLSYSLALLAVHKKGGIQISEDPYVGVTDYRHSR